jgi:hypothetical protein
LLVVKLKRGEKGAEDFNFPATPQKWRSPEIKTRKPPPKPRHHHNLVQAAEINVVGQYNNDGI